MKTNRCNNANEGYQERVILDGNRRTYPCMEVYYLKEEDWTKGRVYIRMSHESDFMSIDQFEIFIAMYRKIVEVARRKEQELDAQPDDLPMSDDMPHVEMSFLSNMEKEKCVYFVVDDNCNSCSPTTAERFADLMEKLLAKGKEIMKIAA